MKIRHASFSLALAALLATAPLAAAQETAPATAPYDHDLGLAAGTTVKIVISPQPPERPDLAYALLPKPQDMQSGNAALKYHIAIESLPRPDTNDNFNGIEHYQETLDKLRTCPLAELDSDLASRITAQHSLKELAKAARYDSVDWQINFRDEGFATLLPHLSALRSLNNQLVVAVRADIKARHWTDARDKLQTGYALARHVGQGATLIETLVGLAVADSMNKCVEEWISQPDSPNLYWPLTDLPRPFNDMRRSFNFERSVVYFAFPEMHRMGSDRFSAAEWINFTNRFPEVTEQLGAISEISNAGSPEWQRQLLGELFAALEYPQGKKFLIERGMKPEEVEKLPVPAVLGKYFLRSYDEAADSYFKWTALPVYQGGPAAAEFEREIASPKTNLLVRMVVPSLIRARLNAAKLDRHFNALRVVEAIRAYAAEHHSLPASLSELALPISIDDTTGQPFVYSRTGADAATLSSPNAKPRDALHYEITLRSSK